MKRMMLHIYTVVLLVLCCTGCGQKELPDTYVEGSDYQYMNLGSFQFQLDSVRGSKGVYILHDDYIFFLDEEAATILPLCSKADCLHDKETDSEKYTYCNACMLPENGFPTDMMGISYCNGFLYCLDQGWPGQPSTLYRLSEDGSKKEVIYQWNGPKVGEWLIHRDILYYTEKTHQVVDGKPKDTFKIMALSLKDLTKQPEVIYTPDEELDIFTLGKPNAYGNYFYFQLIAQKPSEEEITDDNFLEYTVCKTFVYDIKNRQVSEIMIPDMSPSQFVQGVVFWKDKIIFDEYDFLTSDDVGSDYYIADLDGSNPELFMQDIPKYNTFASDGNYLYLTNTVKVERGREEEANLIYEVYNEAGEKIDAFRPLTMVTYKSVLPLGAGKMYLPYRKADENDPTWGVMIWDKSGIGAYGGEPFDKDVTKIVR